jgi:hypothetical protein
MHKFLIGFFSALLLTVSVSAEAGGYGHRGHHHHYRGHGYGWVAPFIVGGIVTYAVTRPTVVYSAPAPQPQVVYVEAAPQPQYWYYCKERQAYHPYVTSCPSPWMQVVPH